MQTADIVMLCAGTSSRMGKTNKMLIPYKGNSLAAFSCLEALKYLSTLEDGGNLIAVTGYRHASLVKTLRPCIEFTQKTDKKIKLIIVNNKDYRAGQFSSSKTGVKEVRENTPFFISLADMPFVTSTHYAELGELPEGKAAVRPFADNSPGHPVLHAPFLREKILSAPDSSSIREILKKETVCRKDFADRSWIIDLDTEEDLSLLENL